MRVLTDEPDVDGVPDPLKDLVVKTLAKNPEERPDAAGLLESLRRIWQPDAEVSASVEEEVTRLLDRTWVMPAPEEAEWVVPPRRRRWRDFGVAAAVTVVAAGLIATTAVVVSGRSSDGVAAHRMPSPASPSGATTQSPTPTGDRPTAAQGDSTGTASPAGTASASPRPTRTGRRVTMVRGYSFILPDDWMYFPDNTHNIEGMCLRPKDKRNDEYWYCHQFGMSIHPWVDGGDPDFRPEEVEPDGVTARYGPEGACGEIGEPVRPSRFLKTGLHRIGNRRAYYWKARSYCRDGTTVEAEMLILPVTGLTISIDEMPAKRRAQVEEILKSFRFPS